MFLLDVVPHHVSAKALTDAQINPVVIGAAIAVAGIVIGVIIAIKRR
jgi:hypothetical protein